MTLTTGGPATTSAASAKASLPEGARAVEDVGRKAGTTTMTGGPATTLTASVKAGLKGVTAVEDVGLKGGDDDEPMGLCCACTMGWAFV